MGFSQEFMVFCVSACMLLVVMMIIRRKSTELRLPPSPPRWPIIGHLHLLHKPIHQCFHKLAQKYGPIFFIKMGSTSAVVISSPDWAKEFFHTHDRNFADRPLLEGCKRLFYNNRSMIMMEHGPLWRYLRKLYTVQILNVKPIAVFEKMRHDEMAMSVKLIKSQALIEGSCGVDIRKLVFNTVGNMMTRMLFGKRSFDASEAIDGRESKFKDMIEEFSLLFGTPVLGDMIPWLQWLDIKGCKKRMDNLAKRLDAFFEDILAERIERRGDNEVEEASDYLDLLLNIYKEDGKVDKESIKCILLDLLIASTETSTTTVEWALAELLKEPKWMKKLQEELQLDKLKEGFEDTELAKLRYLQAVIKETLRLHPPFAVISRRMCKDLTHGFRVGDYHLPKGIRVLCNVWSMGRDTSLWGPNAHCFCPDRFFTSSAPDLRGQHFEFLPFGAGRRGCPGLNLALTITSLILASLVRGFDWEIPSEAPLDLFDEGVAFATLMVKPLVAIPTLRNMPLTR